MKRIIIALLVILAGALKLTARSNLNNGLRFYLNYNRGPHPAKHA